MDLQWKTARMRRWIELGERENLTFRELAKRAGVHARTVSRWSRTLRVRDAEDGGYGAMDHAPRDPGAVEAAARGVLPNGSFVELGGAGAAPTGRIEIRLSGDRRIVVEGAVEVEALVQVIRAVEQC